MYKLFFLELSIKDYLDTNVKKVLYRHGHLEAHLQIKSSYGSFYPLPDSVMFVTSDWRTY